MAGRERARIFEWTIHFPALSAIDSCGENVRQRATCSVLRGLVIVDERLGRGARSVVRGTRRYRPRNDDRLLRTTRGVDRAPENCVLIEVVERAAT